MRRRHLLPGLMVMVASSGLRAQSARLSAVDPAPQLELNRAERADLESLAGIGPSLAERILTARQTAPFSSWSDLMRRVSGLGPKLAHQLSRQGLRVQGQAYRPDS